MLYAIYMPALGFNGAETNWIIAHVLSILLIISYCFAFYFCDIIVVCTVSIYNSFVNGLKAVADDDRETSF